MKYSIYTFNKDIVWIQHPSHQHFRLGLQWPLICPSSLQIRRHISLSQTAQGPLYLPERQSASAILAARTTIVITARKTKRNLICTIATDVPNESGTLLEFSKTFGIDSLWGRLYRTTPFAQWLGASTLMSHMCSYLNSISFQETRGRARNLAHCCNR